MAGAYEHLQIPREATSTERRRPVARFPRVTEPEEPAKQASEVSSAFHAAKMEQDESAESIGGFDDRYLFRLSVRGKLDPSAFEAIGGGVEFISQEDEDVVLIFADQESLSVFQERLGQLMKGKAPTRKDVLWALVDAANWTADDRKGWALEEEDFPDEDTFLLDAELWPLRHFRPMVDRFERWLGEQGIKIVDQATAHYNLLLFRVRVNRDQADKLLQHRDIRLVDLPPRFGVDRAALNLPIEHPPLESPDDTGPVVAVLDSGLAAGHPFLAPAIGDSQSFLGDDDPSDNTGHGTAVAGIALWGEVEAAVRDPHPKPPIWLLSGKVLYDEYGQPAYDHRLIENQVTEAVEYFVEEYQCRVFNLSFGDRRRPYDGKHLRGLAVTLDMLAREHGVLFVVSTGNFEGNDSGPNDWRTEYPEYLLKAEHARILDPATAINVLTVGSYALEEATFDEQRYKPNIETPPIARAWQPSPFTRRGPTVGGAVKPELVAHGGNLAVRRNASLLRSSRGLGRISTSYRFASGRTFCEMSGTSFAAPHIAHLAARLHGEFPRASANLMRALLVAHARRLPQIEALLQENETEKASDRERITKLCGYGQVVVDTLYRSTDEEVVLYAEDSLSDDQHHFYRIPLPDELFSSGLRTRELTVTLAYTAPVRSTRLDYKATRIYFRLVEGASVEDVRASFDAETKDDDHIHRSEIITGRTHPTTSRDAGTVQSSTWRFRAATKSRRENDLFVVVTRNDQLWAEGLCEDQEHYALVIGVRDREREGAQLYAKIQAILQTRARV